METLSRLDHVITEKTNLSRSAAQQYIRAGHVRVNRNVIIKPAHLVTKKDSIEIDDSNLARSNTPNNPLNAEESASAYPAQSYPLRDYAHCLVYEDRNILLLNKPKGCIVHRASGVKESTLCDWLVAYYPPIASVGQPDRPGIVHRLDKHTDGIMVVAKTEAAYAHLIDQFKNRTVTKRYHAWVRGDVSQDELTLSYPIGRHPNIRYKMSVLPEGHPNGKSATTIIRVLARHQTKTLIEAQLITGRTHQIRVHCAHIGHPVLGDPLYGPKKDRGDGQQLSAVSLALTHPITNARWKVIVSAETATPT